MSTGQEGIPSELVDSFESFASAVSKIEKAIEPLIATPRTEMLKKFTPLEVAKLDLVCAYSINSIFWMHLITQGVNPRNHDIKGEIDRVKSYMGKVREIEDRKNAPKLEKEAAKRFVRNAMFDVNEKNQQKRKEEVPASERDDVTASNCESKNVEVVQEPVTENAEATAKLPVDDDAAKWKSGKRKHKMTEKSQKKFKKSRTTT